jgi:hypothetical protein
LEPSANKFTGKDLSKIEDLFSEKFDTTGSPGDEVFSIRIKSEKNNSLISLEIIPDEDDKKLISVYTNNSHLQLQSCSYFIVSEMLEEVIFLSEMESFISGLIISKQGDCSLYANVNKSILKSDFLELNSEKLLSAVALSVTESINQ